MVEFKFSVSTLLLCVIIFNKFTGIYSVSVKYEPTWESLDKRPLPKWYDKARIGIFLHWGVYSVPSYSQNGASEWFWHASQSKSTRTFMEKKYPPQFKYQDFARDFTAEFFDPVEWAKLFEKSGAKYVVFTSKHHDGYALWPSTYSFGWNAKDVGSHRDLVGDLAKAIRKTTHLKFGLYYSLYEWFNPIYHSDRKSKFKKNAFVNNKVYPEMCELINKYQPAVLWADGDWVAPDDYWKSREFLAWLYNDSPVNNTIVVNDRWGEGIPCSHGDFFTCKDRFNPGVLQRHKWENAMTIDKKSWGYRRNAKLKNYLTTAELINTIVKTTACGGNILINVGPTGDGRITPIFEERLLDMGKWLSINGKAIYASTPWLQQHDTISDVWYTSKTKNVYAITLVWPTKNILKLGLVSDLFKVNGTSVTLLGYSDKLPWKISNTTVDIHFPNKSDVESEWAWVVKIRTYN